MIKSKHFRKDVIIARVIFLLVCILLIAGIVWGISYLTGLSDGGTGKDTEQENSDTGYGDSESESESDSEPYSEPESEIGTEPDTDIESTEPDEPVKMYIEVTSRSNLNLRKEPNTNCEVITSLPKGTKAELVEELDGWFKIIYNGHEGYINSDYAKIVEE